MTAGSPGRQSAEGSDAVWPPDPDGVRGMPTSATLTVVSGSAIGLGVALVAMAYGLGREQSGLAAPVFWIGQILAFCAAIHAGSSRRITPAARRMLVLLYVLGQAVMTYAYSPVVFRFPDELQHYRTLTDILASGHLFTPNPTLPVSPGFPGLEIVTAFVHHLTGLSVTESGRLVATIAHILLGGTVFVLMRSLRLSERVATIGVVMFVASPPNIMFNSLFIYGALAIPFVWITVVAALRPARSGVWLPAMLGVGSALICIVTHPASAMFALGGLWLVLVVAVVRRDRVIVRRLAITAGISTGFAVCWVLLRSPEVVGYMSQPFDDVLSALSSGSRTADRPRVVQRPLWESLVVYAAVLLQAAIVVYAVRLAWRERAPRRSLIFVGCSLLFFVVMGLRFVSGSGSELSTRAWAYVGAFTAAATGVVIVRLLANRRLVPLIAGGVVVLIVGNVLSGWPGAWERIPGTEHVAAFEAGVSAETIGLGNWAAANLPAGTRVACDLVACGVVAAYSQADPAKQVATVFYAESFDEAVLAERDSISYDFVIVDRRMVEEAPVSGTFFALSGLDGDTGERLSAAALAKFDNDVRVQRVFDDGLYAVYDLRGLPGPGEQPVG